MIKYLRMVFSSGHLFFTKTRKFNKYAKNPRIISAEKRFSYAYDFLSSLNEKAFHSVLYIKGLESVPKGQCIFVPNHISTFDPIALILASDRPLSIIAKKEVRKMPYVGKVNRALGGFFIDRYDFRKQIETFKEIDKEIKRDKTNSFVIFPEGTRSFGPDFSLLDFHSGSFKLAIDNNLPIIPVCIYLSDRILNQKYHYKRYPVQVSYLKPLLPEQYNEMNKKEIADYCKKVISEELEILKKKDREYVKLLNNYTDKKTDRVLLVSYDKKNKKHRLKQEKEKKNFAVSHQKELDKNKKKEERLNRLHKYLKISEEELPLGERISIIEERKLAVKKEKEEQNKNVQEEKKTLKRDIQPIVNEEKFSSQGIMEVDSPYDDKVNTYLTEKENELSVSEKAKLIQERREEKKREKLEKKQAKVMMKAFLKEEKELRRKEREEEKKEKIIEAPLEEESSAEQEKKVESNSSLYQQYEEKDLPLEEKKPLEEESIENKNKSCSSEDERLSLLAKEALDKEIDDFNKKNQEVEEKQEIEEKIETHHLIEEKKRHESKLPSEKELKRKMKRSGKKNYR